MLLGLGALGPIITRDATPRSGSHSVFNWEERSSANMRTTFTNVPGTLTSTTRSVGPPRTTHKEAQEGMSRPPERFRTVLNHFAPPTAT